MKKGKIYNGNHFRLQVSSFCLVGSLQNAVVLLKTVGHAVYLKIELMS